MESVYPYKYTYAGKIEDNFEYSYTVKLTQTSFFGNRNSYDELVSDKFFNGHTGTITFSNASNCVAIVPMFFYNSWRWVESQLVFTKK